MNSGNKIEQILGAAEEIMSQKGLAHSSIAEIAKRAAITDSVIYNYFKGKEDLLFSVAGRRIREFVQELSEQLQGIIEPLSKLSKLMWFHLHFNDTYRDYARLLILECRSNRNLYKHEAYSYIRQYAGVLLGVLESGVEKGVFRSDVNMRLVRDIIFGVLDWENLSCLAAQEIENATPDLEDILALIIPMIAIPPKGRQTELDKSNRILRAAERVFAEKGYTQATISEIAKLSAISEGTIYEYFENKEDLLLSIPERRFKEHIDALEEIFEIKDPSRKLRRLIRYHFSLYLRERDFLKVFLLHIQLNKKFYDSPVYEIFKQYTQVIIDTLEEGKREGSIRANVNNRVFENLFLGAFSHMGLRWFILGKEAETNMMKEIDEVVSLLLRAVTCDIADHI